jgi:hypothetical protein
MHLDVHSLSIKKKCAQLMEGVYPTFWRGPLTIGPPSSTNPCGPGAGEWLVWAMFSYEIFCKIATVRPVGVLPGCHAHLLERHVSKTVLFA